MEMDEVGSLFSALELGSHCHCGCRLPGEGEFGQPDDDQKRGNARSPPTTSQLLVGDGRKGRCGGSSQGTSPRLSMRKSTHCQ
jgi:hypothetical protein